MQVNATSPKVTETSRCLSVCCGRDGWREGGRRGGRALLYTHTHNTTQHSATGISAIPSSSSRCLPSAPRFHLLLNYPGISIFNDTCEAASFLLLFHLLSVSLSPSPLHSPCPCPPPVSSSASSVRTGIPCFFMRSLTVALTLR